MFMLVLENCTLSSTVNSHQDSASKVWCGDMSYQKAKERFILSPVHLHSVNVPEIPYFQLSFLVYCHCPLLKYSVAGCE